MIDKDLTEAMLETDIRNIHKYLNASIAPEKARMPERNFVHVFLPFFTGEGNPYNVSVQTWVGFAGGPFWEVDVIDSKGDVLFTVPAVADQTRFSPLTQTEGLPSMSHVVHTAAQLANRHPMEGKRYLQRELSVRESAMKNPGVVLENLKAWNAIFARYGKPPIVEVAETAPSAATDKLSDDDFDYA